VNKITLPIALRTHALHYIRTNFLKLLFSSACVHLRMKAVAIEKSCVRVYSVVYVFWRWRKNPVCLLEVC